MSAQHNAHCAQETRTGRGVRRRMTKPSARIIMKRVNLWQRIFSISSACLIEIEIRIELIEGSMSTLSDSLRDTIRGLRSTSGVVLVVSGAPGGRVPKLT